MAEEKQKSIIKQLNNMYRSELRFSAEDMAYLSQFEKSFFTAVNAGYSPCLPANDLVKIQTAMNNLTGVNNKINTGCQHCISRLMREAGEVYFSTLTDTMIVAEKSKRGRKPKNAV